MTDELVASGNATVSVAVQDNTIMLVVDLDDDAYCEVDLTPERARALVASLNAATTLVALPIAERLKRSEELGANIIVEPSGAKS